MAKIFGQRVARDLRDCACHFHPGRSAANDYKSHRRLACCFVGDLLRVFECHQKAAPKLDRVLETFQSRRQFFPFVMSEIGMPRASGKDQEVITDFRIGRSYFFGIDIHRFDLGKNYVHILGFAQYGAHWRSNVGWRQRSGRNLVE